MQTDQLFMGILTGLAGFTGYLIKYIITRSDKASDQHDAMQRDVLTPLIASNNAVAAGLRDLTDVVRRASTPTSDGQEFGPRYTRQSEGRDR